MTRAPLRFQDGGITMLDVEQDQVPTERQSDERPRPGVDVESNVPQVRGGAQ
jgi:hypothetical protein